MRFTTWKLLKTNACLGAALLATAMVFSHGAAAQDAVTTDIGNSYKSLRMRSNDRSCYVEFSEVEEKLGVRTKVIIYDTEGYARNLSVPGVIAAGKGKFTRDIDSLSKDMCARGCSQMEYVDATNKSGGTVECPSGACDASILELYVPIAADAHFYSDTDCTVVTTVDNGIICKVSAGFEGTAKVVNTGKDGCLYLDASDEYLGEAPPYEGASSNVCDEGTIHAGTWWSNPFHCSNDNKFTLNGDNCIADYAFGLPQGAVIGDQDADKNFICVTMNNWVEIRRDYPYNN